VLGRGGSLRESMNCTWCEFNIEQNSILEMELAALKVKYQRLKACFDELDQALEEFAWSS